MCLYKGNTGDFCGDGTFSALTVSWSLPYLGCCALVWGDFTTGGNGGRVRRISLNYFLQLHWNLQFSPNKTFDYLKNLPQSPK